MLKSRLLGSVSKLGKRGLKKVLFLMSVKIRMNLIWKELVILQM